MTPNTDVSRPQSPHRASPRRFGFVELVVVLSILISCFAILASMVEAFGQRARRVRCAGILARNYTALAMYAADFRDLPYQHPFGGTAREDPVHYVSMLQEYLSAPPDYDAAKGLFATCPSLRDTGGDYGFGYHYFGNYTWNRPGTLRGCDRDLTYPGTRRAMTFEDLQRSAALAEPKKPFWFGDWVLMADRIQIVKDTQVYDLDASRPGSNGAVAHLRRGALTGGNILWSDGSVVWRPISPELRCTPWIANGANTGVEGWVRNNGSPGIDALLPVEVIDIRYQNGRGAYTSPFQFDCLTMERIALEEK